MQYFHQSPKEDVYLHAYLEFWTYTFANGDHNDNFGCFDNFYGYKRGRLGIKGRSSGYMNSWTVIRNDGGGICEQCS